MFGLAYIYDVYVMFGGKWRQNVKKVDLIQAQES